MTTTATPPEAAAHDPYDARVARKAGGLLRAFNDAGIVAAADVHVALRLGRLGDTDDEAVLLGAALAVRAPRLGHVCVDLGSIRTTASSDLDEAIDVRALPWPDPVAWIEALAASALAGADRPLRIEGETLYLDRYWSLECRVAADLLDRATRPVAYLDMAALAGGLDRLFGTTPADAEPDLQRLAAAVAVLRRFSVIAGGPGTGKTTTVARVIALLDEQEEVAGRRRPLVALAAPTGKAAVRLQEAVREEAQRLPPGDPSRDRLMNLQGVTIHRLLGYNPGNSTRFRHNRANRLAHDVVVVDETSMVPLAMMARLAEAVRPDARLVLVGDPEQLASVEAGAVLGDIVGPANAGLRMLPPARELLGRVAGAPVPATDPPSPTPIGDGIVVLRRPHRFGGLIAELAAAIQAGAADAVVELLAGGGDELFWRPAAGGAAVGEVELGARPLGAGSAEAGSVDAGSVDAGSVDAGSVDAGSADAGGLVSAGPAEAGEVDAATMAALREAAVTAGRAVTDAAREGRAADAIAALGKFRVLCAHRRGTAGASTWMSQIERWLAAEINGFGAEGTWYAGRPLLITANDYSLRLYNGDTGVVVNTESGRVAAAFERDGGIVEVSPTRLAAVDTVYAMTVHKAQGSQFEKVAVVLPAPDSPILTRELLYTAVTRARRAVILAGTEEAIRTAIGRPIARSSGLGRRLWG